MNPPLDIHENVPLAPLTTLKIGGNARYFVRAETESQVAEAVKFADSNGFKLFVLGGGSNVLVSDMGFDGVVLQIAISGIELPESKISNLKFEMSQDPDAATPEPRFVNVGAGENWDPFVKSCVNNNLAGVECLSGIPGLVGGTPVQNVGAYGQEVSETIVEVRCLDRKSREIVTLSNAECGFSYRTSIFNSTQRDRFIVLNVTFGLQHGGEPKIVYKDLVELFSGEKPSLDEVREAVLTIRRQKSMVIDKDDPNSLSAGSFFKNPIVAKETLERIRSSFENVPYFEFGEMVKIPAAWLIENVGFKKGFALGNAGISSNHTLALINRGDASAAEIIVLKERIQAAVAEKFGIDLSPEPVFIGFLQQKKLSNLADDLLYNV